MSATSIIRTVRAAGGEITLADDRIKLKIPASVHDKVIAEIRTHKGAIKRALKSEADDPWAAEDWRALYDERAGIAEFDGGQTRAEAEARAFECCIVEWLNRHPQPSNPGHCAWCRTAETSGAHVVACGTSPAGRAWLHPVCWQPWHDKRRQSAISALADFNIDKPGKEVS